jgi:hypothetical protein
MDELMDMIVADESPSQISDKIKDLLFAKSAERIDSAKPYVADSIFSDESEDDSENYYGDYDSSDEEE